MYGSDTGLMKPIQMDLIYDNTHVLFHIEHVECQELPMGFYMILSLLTLLYIP